MTTIDTTPADAAARTIDRQIRGAGIGTAVLFTLTLLAAAVLAYRGLTGNGTYDPILVPLAAVILLPATVAGVLAFTAPALALKSVATGRALAYAATAIAALNAGGWLLYLR